MKPTFINQMIEELILIRHGEADHIIGKKTGGWSNTHLTEYGKVQAQKTGQFLATAYNLEAFAVYSSDLIRTVETTQILNESIQKKPKFSSALRELSNGDAKDLTQDQAQRLYNPPTKPLLDWIAYPNGESWRIFCDRIYRYMEELNDQETQVLVVSHGNAICAMIHWWLEFDYTKITHIAYDIDLCSITYLRINEWGEKTIRKLNQTIFL